MNWKLIFQYAISGAIVSWPVFIAGLAVNWRKTRSHVDRRTAEQNETFARITEEQTRTLLSDKPAGGVTDPAGRVSDPAGKYHGHGQQDPGQDP